jgi:hypothetical protein
MLTIGADPEFFVRRRNHWVSGHVFNCGTKEFPMPTEHGSVQVDGVALECNVHPAVTEEGFLANVRGVERDLIHVVKSSNPLCELVVRPSVYLGTGFLRSLPRHARTLGCSPDYNAYTGSANHSPNPRSPIRTGSGHVHLGWTHNADPGAMVHFDFCCALAKQLDFFLGLPSLLWDADQRRRSLYGMAGAFRPKAYGMEYRVLSNAWLRDDELIRRVFRGATKAFNTLDAGRALDDRYPQAAHDCINQGVRDWPTMVPQLAEEVLNA